MAKETIKGMGRLQAKLAGTGTAASSGLMEKLLEQAIAMAGKTHINVGFLDGATYPKKGSDGDKSGLSPGSPYESGIPVAVIAFLNEFGGTIDVPEHTQTIYRSFNADGTFRKNGRFVKKKSSNFATDHVVKAHTITIPARAFMRKAIAENQDDWSNVLAKSLRAAKGDVRKALNITAEEIVNQVQAQIREIAANGGNASSTARKKGFDSPLIDTGHMLNSVGYEVVDD